VVKVPILGKRFGRLLVIEDSPENCQWSNDFEQARNRRGVRLITCDGATKALAEWCEDLGLNYWTAHARLRRGATDREALGL